MRFLQRTVEPTLFLSAVGVLVETLKQPAFATSGLKPPPHTQAVAPPNGAAVVAVQFTHRIGVAFLGLQCFQLSYHQRAPGRDLMEEFLAQPFDDLRMAATPIEASALSADQRRVVVQLLAGSDAKGWENSPEFRAQLGA